MMNIGDWIDDNFDQLETEFLTTPDGKMMLDDDRSDLGDNPKFQEWAIDKFKGENARRDIQ